MPPVPVCRRLPVVLAEHRVIALARRDFVLAAVVPSLGDENPLACFAAGKDVEDLANSTDESPDASRTLAIA